MTAKKNPQHNPETGNEQVTLQNANAKIAEGLAALKQLGMVGDLPNVEQLLAAARPKKKRPTKDGKAPDTVDAFIQWFVQSPEDKLYDVKCGQWECVTGNPEKERAHALVFHSRSLNDEKRKRGAHIVCIRGTAGKKVPIFNASRITYSTSHDAQKKPQELAEQLGAVPVPFETVIQDAKLNLFKTQVLDWSGAERMLIPPVGYNGYSYFNIINRHFAGAVLLKVDKGYFLFDADREELKYHNFNPFFTQLPRPADTIADAYEALMPKEVRAALNEGKAVVRQGEFFFVPVPDTEVETLCREFSKRPEAYTDQTLPHIIHSADVYAALEHNYNKYEEVGDVDKWLVKYEAKLRKLKGSERDNPDLILDPEAAIAWYREWLDTQEGKPEGHLTTTQRNKMRKDTWSRVQDYIPSEIGEELRVRLRERTGMDRDYQLHLDMVYSAHAKGGDNDDTRQSEGHQITLTFVHPTDRKVRYARGHVTHRARQHRPVLLTQWYRVYTNSAMANWTVHGDVD